MSAQTTQGAAAAATGPRALLVAVLESALDGSASFADALQVVERSGSAEPRAVTRELLGDLAIRSWIELRAVALGREEPVPRRRYELELTDARNWDRTAKPAVVYALTDTGRERAAAMGASG